MTDRRRLVIIFAIDTLWLASMVYVQFTQVFEISLGIGIVFLTTVLGFTLLFFAVPLTMRPPGRLRTIGIVHIIVFALLIIMTNRGIMPPF